MCAWCMAARLSHTVVAIEVPMAPAVMRVKLLRPAADGIRSGGMPAKVSVVKGMKNMAMAAPCSTVGIRMWARSVCTVNCERIHSTTAKPKKAMVAMRRGSQTVTFLPIKGVSKIAKMPTGARASPALVAV